MRFACVHRPKSGRLAPIGGVVRPASIGYTESRPCADERQSGLRVIANQRYLLRFVQALLALVLLVCLPAFALDEAQAPFLTELSDGVENEAVGDPADDGRPDPGRLADTGRMAASHREASAAQWAQAPQLGRPALPDGLNRATGPPRG